MADLLDRVLREIRERKEAARAAVEETRRLEAALAALDGQRKERPTRTGTGTTRRQRSGGRARAPRGANQAALMDVVSQRPGITAAEAASATGIARATAGATLARLVGKGILEYVELPAGERGYRLVEATSEPAGRVSNKPEEAN